jgi:hypothetical protein
VRVTTRRATTVDRTGDLAVRHGTAASPGPAILVPTDRHAEVAGEVILELPQLPVIWRTTLTARAHTLYIACVYIACVRILRGGLENEFPSRIDPAATGGYPLKQLRSRWPIFIGP